MDKTNFNEEWNDIFWSFNLPVQMFKDAHTGLYEPTVYMARKNTCARLDETVKEEHLAEFCDKTIERLENLIRLFKEVKDGTSEGIYYPDEGMDSKE